jgi:hypothetical protein
VVDDAGDDDDIPMAKTELIGKPSPPPEAPPPRAAAPPPPPPSANRFDEISDFLTSTNRAMPPLPYDEQPTEVPMASIEIPLPEGILSSLPDLSAPLKSSLVTPSRPVERRSTDGLVKEVTVPLNLTAEELRGHRKLRLKITLDVNLLP